MKKLTLNTGSGAIELIDRRALRTVVSGVQVIDLNATDKCTVKVRSAEPFDIPIGATCTIFGRFYRMNYLPRVEKIEERLFETDIELEGVQYDLIRAIYDLTIDTTSNQLQDVRGDALTGDLNRFATVLIANANRIFPGGWRLGECPTTAKDITLTFGETDNCLLVLQRLCQEFKTEFDVSTDNGVFVLNLRKVGRVLPFRFEFGRGRGVYRLERQNVSQSNIITRLKVQGASKNLTSKYRSSRLCLPGKSKNLSFVEDPAKVEKYGLFETRKFFDDIYPTRTGKVTGIRAGDVLQFSDDTMFDLNERDDSGATKYLLPGTAAKIHFNSGNLAGYEFDIVSYDHTTHTFKIKAITDERNETFPSGKSTAFQFSVGDEYKLLQITLPQSYIDDAERRLKEEAEKLYAQKSQPEVTYGLTLEELFIRKLYGQASGTILNVGDYVQVKDDDLMVDKSLRIAGFTRDLINEYKYNLTISEAPVSSSIISKIVEGLAEIDRVLTINDLRNTARSRRNWRDTQELLNLIFDPDGYFLSEKIKPLSIETSMLSVGAKSAQLMLNGVVIEPNSGGNPNQVSVTSGTLDHLTISDSIRTWSIHGGAMAINDDEAHYVYARCAKDGSVGTIAFDKSKLMPEDEAGYYNFLIGVLHSVRDNVRGISLTYGSSTINGRFITTGVIQSENGQSFFDLDNNSFRIGDNRSGLSWNLNGDRTLRLKGGTIVQSQGGDEDFLPYDRGAWTNGMTVYPYDIVSYNGYRWLWRGADPTTSMPGTSGEWEKKGEVPQSPYSVTLSSYERVIKEGGEGLRQELKVVTGDKQVMTQGREVVTSQYSLSTHITVLRGDRELLYSDTVGEGVYTVTLRANGLSATINAGNVIVTNVGDGGGHVEIEVNCEGKAVITKRFSVVIAKDGEDGKDGVGISLIKERYAAGTEWSVPSTGWCDSYAEVQLTAEKNCVWNYEMIIYTNGAVKQRDPHIIYRRSTDGTAGASVTDIQEWYAVSDNNVTAPPSSAWSKTPPQMSKETPYLWNYSVTYFDDGRSFESPKVVIGRWGEDGKDGRDGENGKSPKIVNGTWWVWDGSKWVDTHDPAQGESGENGKSPKIQNGTWWVWDGEKWVDTGVKAKGDKGTDGKDGKDGKDAHSPKIVGGTWWVWDDAQGRYVDTHDPAQGESGENGKSPKIQNGTWWVWDGEKWVDTGVKAKGDKGTDGKDGRGVDLVVKEWAKTSDPDNPPAQGSSLWSSIPPKPEAGKYIWERTKTVMTDNNVQYTTPVRVELTGVSKALEEAFETSTEIKGGLVATTMLLVRNALGKIRAYFSGAGDKTGDIAFAAGVENFGLDTETQATYIKQNGDAKFGEMYMDANGQVYAMRDGKRYFLLGGAIPTLEQLIAGEGDDVIANGRRNYFWLTKTASPKVYTLSDNVTVKNAGASIIISGMVELLYDINTDDGSPGEGYPNWNAKGQGVWANLYLYKGNAKHKLIKSYSLPTDYNVMETLFYPTIVDQPGTYSLRVEVSFKEPNRNQGYMGALYSGTVRGYFVGAGDFSHFGDDGMAISRGKGNFLHFDTKGLKIGEKTSFPGVLCAGVVERAGGVSKHWGAHKYWRDDRGLVTNRVKAELLSTGTYKVYHTIGHSNYIPMLTPYKVRSMAMDVYEISDYYFVVRCWDTRGKELWSDGFTYVCFGQGE